MIFLRRLGSVRVRWPMTRVGTLACIPFAFVGVLAALAQGLSVDWKFYGGAAFDEAALDEKSECFYDAKGVVHGPVVRVWKNASCKRTWIV